MILDVFVQLGWLLALVGFILLGSTLGALGLCSLGITVDRWLDRQLIQLTLGWLVMGFAVYVLGSLHLLYTPLLIASSMGLMVAAWWVQPWSGLSFSSLRTRALELPWPMRIVALFGFIIAGVLLVGALAPDAGFDSTWYHLPEAQLYLREHSTAIHYPAMLGESAVVPRLFDLLYPWALAPWPAAPTLPQLIHWASGVGLGVAAFAIARRAVRAPAALLAAVLVYTAKPTLWLSKIAYVDLAVGFFGSVVVVALLAWSARPKAASATWPVLIGVLLGGFLSAKMQSLVFWPLALVGVWLVRRRFADVGWALLVSLLLTLPWYLEIWVATGTPLFTFRRPPGDEHLGGGSSFTDWIVRIHPRTFIPDILRTMRDQAAFALAAGATLLAWPKLSGLVRLLVGAGLVGLVAWSYVPVHEIRYGLVVLPLLAVGLGWLYEVSNRPIRTALLMSAGVILFLNFCLTVSIGRGAFQVGLGLEPRHDYMSRAFGGHLWIYYDHDRQVAPLVGAGRALTLIHNPAYVNFPALDAVRLMGERYQDATRYQEIRAVWRERGITHLVTHGPFALKDFLPASLSPDEQFQLTLASRVVYADGQQTTVWELLP